MNRIMRWKNKRSANFAWTKQLSVGNAILDSEHRNLITKINNILHLIEAGDYAALPDAFELLETWLMTHFENERTFAQAINFDFGQHELAHRRLLDELRHLKDELASENWAASNSRTVPYYQLLRDWLIGHITDEDMRMKPALHGCQYDYIPSMAHSEMKCNFE